MDTYTFGMARSGLMAAKLPAPLDQLVELVPLVRHRQLRGQPAQLELLDPLAPREHHLALLAQRVQLAMSDPLAPPVARALTAPLVQPEQ